MIIYLAFNQVAPYYSFVVAPRNQPTPSRRRQQDTHFWCYFGANPVQPDLPDLSRDEDQDRSPSLKIYAATLRNPPVSYVIFPISPNFCLRVTLIIPKFQFNIPEESIRVGEVLPQLRNCYAATTNSLLPSYRLPLHVDLVYHFCTH